jgi:hopene-associated glycosyltransferase HpnB
MGSVLGANSIAIVTVVVWLYLLAGRGWFWRLREDAPLPLGRTNLSVAAVLPARDEAAVIGEALASLLAQAYPGSLHIFVVDDHSSDATAAIARKAAPADRLTVLTADSLPSGWTGKLWALDCGLRLALARKPDYLLFTDADIVHAPRALEGLVARAEKNGLDLASLMVKLRCESAAERALIPAFLYFFLKLYPPTWIEELDSRTAGAAGGCILLRTSALRRIGGIEKIRGELIDDCALAREVKRGGPIWMGITSASRSIRAYDSFGEIGGMIARTAFTQLRHSTLLLVGTILGLLITYVAPPVLAIAGPGTVAHVSGAVAWLIMMVTYWPTLRLYKRSPLWTLTLPLVALFYAAATVRSAIAYWSGKGGLWKGRAQDQT